MQTTLSYMNFFCNVYRWMYGWFSLLHLQLQIRSGGGHTIPCNCCCHYYLWAGAPPQGSCWAHLLTNQLLEPLEYYVATIPYRVLIAFSLLGFWNNVLYCNQLWQITRRKDCLEDWRACNFDFNPLFYFIFTFISVKHELYSLLDHIPNAILFKGAVCRYC